MEAIGGLLGLVILVACIWAILQVVKSGAEPVVKIIWVVAIIVLPVVGLIAWLLFGPRG
ncbi:PLDc N-terminal domain-containing protein [Spectribacter hydrogenooxidans]|uniref:PLDc N-terminal domain-containing protein n=1 Tax=Spectribacter hydrogenoxidans TaxID=3075608 RepID=A0ABU3C2E3_9GAMM|nr:PLDc N-terminal domain-containing protein [Salinisphaera sp. W335]MDT0635723.1 PLDc N-terminal domain-containing protein [Salinisphaera sp. W335]